MPRLLSQMLDEAALRAPDAPALRCDGASLTYEELARRAHGVARTLLAGGLAKRDRVAVLLAKGPAVPVAFYGVLAAGGVLVPVDPKSPAAQVSRILQATGARFLIAEPGREAVVSEAVAAAPEIDRVMGLEAVPKGGVALPWAEMEAAATDRPPEVSVGDLDPAYVLHTSGSTGLPKLIQHTHASAMSFVDWAVAEYDLGAEDRLSNHSSHHTCFATFDYYAATRVGAATVVLPPAALMMPTSLSALLEKEAVSIWYSVPTALVQLSLRGGLEERNLEALRWVLFAGESFPAKHLERLRGQLPGARFSHVYGSTETNVCTYYHLPESGEVESPLPIGQACSTCGVEVVDEVLRPVAAGEEGELLVRGSTLMSGYWGEPERNRQVLLRRPVDGELEETYFRTGDRVRALPSGDLTFVTRADDQVKVRGFRVELGEVETALLSVDAVEEAAAFTQPDGEGSSRILAAVVTAPGAAKGETELLVALRRLLPLQALPSRIQILDRLPRTPTGKVDRKALAASTTP